MLNWPAGVVGDPARTSNMVGVVEIASHGRSESKVGVIIISQQFHDLLWIGVAKIVKWEEWGHDVCFINFVVYL